MMVQGAVGPTPSSTPSEADERTSPSPRGAADASAEGVFVGPTPSSNPSKADDRASPSPRGAADVSAEGACDEGVSCAASFFGPPAAEVRPECEGPEPFSGAAPLVEHLGTPEAPSAEKLAAGEEDAGSEEASTCAGGSRTASLIDADSGRRRVSAVCGTTSVGESLALVGAHPALGAWDAKRALVMETSPERFPTWSAEVPRAASGSEFKFVIVQAGGGVVWEPIEGNRVLVAGDGLAATFGKLD